MKNLIFALIILLSSCTDTLTSSLERHSVSVAVELPENILSQSVTDETFTFRNISSGTETVYEAGSQIELIAGLYDVVYEAAAMLDNNVPATLRATLNSVTLTSDVTLRLSPFALTETRDLIISEIFFAGTLTPAGNNYNGDDYIRLYNNTDEVIYADGLALIESKFNTTQKYAYTPDIMDEAFTADAIYLIPGSGHDHPVKPGEYLLLADTGIDHRQLNPYSFDLSAADFEWYDVSTSPANLDIDSPTVPNLDKWYCYTLSYFILHNRGFKAYGLARIPLDKETFLKENLYSFDYTIVSDAGSFPMTATGYKIPNEWIVDMVNCSVKSNYAWTVCAPSLDMGWTSCGIIDKDMNRFFHSVRRKLLYVNDKGNPVFKDTNNSTADFNTDCVPSLIELAGSVMDMNGTPCATVTYDGITPVEK